MFSLQTCDDTITKLIKNKGVALASGLHSGSLFMLKLICISSILSEKIVILYVPLN